MASALEHVHSVATSQREALLGRLQKIREGDRGSRRLAGARRKSSKLAERELLPVSGALRSLQGLINETASGYAVLHAVAHRFYDSKDEGNTADLAEEHLRTYAKASQNLSQLISDVVVWELSKLGQGCQCQCPSCGLGVCLCSPHGTNTVADVLRETISVRVEQGGRGMRLRPPHTDSAARRAGLRDGDVIVAVDGRGVHNESWDSISTLQEAIKKHESGDVVRFQVRRASGAIEELTVVRP